MQNKLKPQTSGVIRSLAAASIRSVMITGIIYSFSHFLFCTHFNRYLNVGDNPLTAVCIAKECGVVPAGMQVFLADAVKGLVFLGLNNLLIIINVEFIDQHGESEIKWNESNDPSIHLDPATLRVCFLLTNNNDYININ